ncbi:MAG: hypothetical protein K5669_10845 [Lachnospiraceae bacterium]|nr:hypothetical protein [Lachnospiraceae bacterium]
MKKNRLGAMAVICLAVGFIFIAIGAGMQIGENSATNTESVTANVSCREMFIGDTPISEYTIKAFGQAGTSAKRLAGYIEEVSGEKIKVSSFANTDKYIEIKKVDSLPEGDGTIEIRDGIISIKARNSIELEKQVDIFANTYLGIAFAGESREHILKGAANIVIPENEISDTDAWMQEREPIICLWKTNATRGVFYNSDTSLKSEILSYSDDQLYNYVRMMKSLGYTGIQVTDMCSAWAYYGNYEFAHDRIRLMADAAHSLGMNFTLWVWGAEFNGYGWVDDSVVYNSNGVDKAFDSPEAIASFEKYYSIYAELADCADRVIAHYNDPGKLKTTEEIAYFASILREKCRAVNPDVNFGVSCYTNEIDARELNERMGGDVTVYFGARKTADETWKHPRDVCAVDRIDFGIWSWCLTEMEIDQIAEMNVNATYIQNTYNLTREEDSINKPTYWSEMDSYHILNIFSHYVAARLLIDPEISADALLLEVSEKIFGSEYASDMYEMLKLVEEARTGDSLDTFYWSGENYVIKSESYDSRGIFEKSKRSLEHIDSILEAIDNGEEISSEIPMPVSVAELLMLIKPHIKQINEYADFRLKMDELKAAAEAGTGKDKLQALLNEYYVPVSEYNVITGVWGIPEARAQYEIIGEFCEKYGLEVPQDPTFIHYRKMRIYDQFITYQKNSKEKVLFNKDYFQWGYAFGKEETIRLTNLLVDDGLLTETDDGLVYITDWERYKFDF